MYWLNAAVNLNIITCLLYFFGVFEVAGFFFISLSVQCPCFSMNNNPHLPSRNWSKLIELDFNLKYLLRYKEFSRRKKVLHRLTKPRYHVPRVQWGFFTWGQAMRRSIPPSKRFRGEETKIETTWSDTTHRDDRRRLRPGERNGLARGFKKL